MVNVLDNKNLKKFIYKRLFESLSDKIYHPYGKEIWIIDLDTQNWYLQFNSEGNLYYNYKFFNDFFSVFGFNRKEYQNFIKSWFETSTGYRINKISSSSLDVSYYIDGITRGNTKEWTLNQRYGFSCSVVKQFLDIKQYISTENIKLNHFIHEIKIY